MDPELAERLARHGSWLDDRAAPLAPASSTDPSAATGHEGVPVLDLAAPNGRPTRRRRAAIAAAAVLAAAAVVAVALVVRTPIGGSGADDGSAGTSVSSSRSAGLELDGRRGDVLVVAETTLPAGDLTLAADAQGLARLWSALATASPQPATDFASSVVVGVTVVGNSCVPTLVRFERTAGPTYTPDFVTDATSCEDLAVTRTFVVRVDRSAIESRFVLRLPAYRRWYEEQRLEVDLGARGGSARLLTPPPVRQGVPTTSASERLDPSGPATTTAVDTTVTLAPPSDPSSGGSSSANSAIVGWRRDGHLLVVDPSTGDVVRELTSVPTGFTGTGRGPGSVTLTPDRRLAIVTWSVGEPGCAARIGAVPTDGSGPLVEWGEGGTLPAVSPDGRRVAWLAASYPDCGTQSLVTRDLATGEERRIVLKENSTSYQGGGGPWWLEDSVTIVYRPEAGGDTAPSYARRALTFDVTAATKRSDAGSVDTSCIGSDIGSFFAQQDEGGGAVLVARSEGEGTPSRIERCAFGSSKPTELAAAPNWVLFATRHRADGRLLLQGIDGSLSIATPDGDLTRVPGSTTFQSAAW